MQSPSDEQLLNQYAKTGSQDAFAELVRRHAGLVFAAASRQVRDFAAAQDVSQVVFMVLARKAASIGPHVPLSAWLLNVARFASLDYLESQAGACATNMGQQPWQPFPKPIPMTGGTTSLLISMKRWGD